MKIKDIDTKSHLKEFDCGNSSINSYLKDSAFYNHILKINRTKIIENEGKIIAFITLSLIELLGDEDIEGNIKYFGVYLEYIGVDKKYQKKGIGSFLIDYIFEETYNISEFIGLRYIILDAIKDKKNWYEQIGFKDMKNSNFFSEKAIRMEHDLRDPYEIKEIFNY